METNDNKVRSDLNRNVSKNWKPVEGLSARPSRMMMSDRVRYWLVSLGGLALAAVGIGIFWLGRNGMLGWIMPEASGKVGGMLIGLGLGIFIIGGPGQAVRNGYRF